MKHSFVKILSGAGLAAALLFLLLPRPAGAVGISVSGGGTVRPGATVTVRVTFSGQNIFGADGTFSYDRQILQYTGGANTSDGNFALVGGSDGLSSLSTTITFKALAVGQTAVSVHCSESRNFALESLGTGSGSTVVTVSETAAPRGTRDPAATPAPPLPEVIIGERTYTVTAPGGEFPPGFVPGEAEIEGRTCPVLVREEPPALLVLLTDNASGEAAYFRYDPGTKAFAPFILLRVTGAYELSSDGERRDVPRGFILTHPPEGFAGAAAWASTDHPGLVMFYVLSGGPEGYYFYDPAEGILWRYREDLVVTVEVPVTPRPAAPTPSPSPGPSAPAVSPSPLPEPALKEGDRLRIIVLSGFSALVIVAIILLIVLIVGRSNPYRKPPGE